jgi:FkbM family methyltransferase
MKKIKRFLWNFLKKIWCKDLDLMSYWLRHWNFKLIIDWIFFWNYEYCWKFWWTVLEHANLFKEYFSNKKYRENLINWLDKESIETVNQLEQGISFVINNSIPFFKKKNFWIKENKTKVKKYIKKYTKDIYLPSEHKEETVFYFKHWINDIKDLSIFIKWKDIIDCWAYIWDSAMMFSKELWFCEDNKGAIKKIYCLEPDPSNNNLLKITIEKNNKKWKIIPIALWVWQKKEKLCINQNWIASTIWIKQESSTTIDVDTIDNIVNDYWINPWLIKRDVEWLEYDSVLWCKNTIKNFKPILIISIYHNWRDFYEIKPLIESRNLWYKFIIKHLSTHPFEESVLICYI